MYLLFKDPKGKNAAVINSQGDSKLSGFSSYQVQNNKCVELEKKVTLLEQAVQEKDKTIIALKNKMDMSDSTMVNGQNLIQVLNIVHTIMHDWFV